YTTFDYAKPSIDKSIVATTDTVTVTFTLPNSGQTDGKETVQLYVSKPNSKVTRPEKELKSFKKVFLKAGESNTVTLNVAVNNFAYFNEAKGDWEVEPGTYTLSIGSSSRSLKGKVEV